MAAPTAAPTERGTQRSYVLEGTLLEACNCGVLCPCWVGEDPDNGTCDAINAYHIDRGEIRGVDVSGLTWMAVVHIPGNVLDGGFRALFYVDESATPEQVDAMADAFRGRLGGPLADLAALVGEEVGILQVPIAFSVEGGRGTVAVGTSVRATMEPYRSATGETTTLRDSIFSTIPGSPAWVGKASELVVDLPEHGFQWRLDDTNAIQGVFVVEG